MAKKLIGSSMSMSELLAALTHAQKERDATLEELRKISEGERKKAEMAEQRAHKLQQDLEAAKKKLEDVSLTSQDLENRLRLEKENCERELCRSQEENAHKIQAIKEKIGALQQKLLESENARATATDELLLVKNKLKNALLSEEDLQSDMKKLKDELTATKDELNKTLKSHEILESELHMAKMQILKESNINNRLLDELKRSRKDIDDYKEEINKLKKIRDSQRSSISRQIKELSILITENNKENFDDDLREIRISLSTILKENFLLSNKIGEVYKFITKGDSEVVCVATQTAIGLDQMFSYENMDREVTNLVMRLREDLVSNKNELVEMKLQNEMLRGLVQDLKREKERNKLIEEEESRVEKLEGAVRSLKQMLQSSEEAETDEQTFTDTLDKMRKDIDMLKIQVRRTPKQEPVKGNFDISSLPPIKLITSRKY